MDPKIIYVALGLIIVVGIIVMVMKKDRYAPTIEQALIGKPTISIIATPAGYGMLNDIENLSYLFNLIQGKFNDQLYIKGLAVESSTTASVPSPYNGLVFFSVNGSSTNVQTIPFGATLDDFWTDLIGSKRMPWNQN